MSLRPIEHPHRLKSAAEAESFFRALRLFGSRASVGVRGHHTKDPARFVRLVNAIEPRRDHTISFENGKMDLDALAVLAKKRFHYLDIKTGTAIYRSWPDMPRTWVYSAVGDAQTVDLTDIPQALKDFGAMTDGALRSGFINGVQEETKPFLVDFLRAIDAMVHVNLHIDLAPARALADLYEGEDFDWGDDGILVDFPEGRIHGFLVTPKVGPEYEARWQKKITKALAKAKLR